MSDLVVWGQPFPAAGATDAEVATAVAAEAAIARAAEAALAAKDVQRVIAAAGAMGPTSGSPALTATGGWGMSGWALDDTNIEKIGGVLAIPDWWVTFDIVCHWIRATTGAGDVRFRFDYKSGGLAVGGSQNTGDTNALVTGTAAAQHILATTTLVSAATAVTVGNSFTFQLHRVANDAADTLVGDAAIVALHAVRVT